MKRNTKHEGWKSQVTDLPCPLLIHPHLQGTKPQTRSENLVKETYVYVDIDFPFICVHEIYYVYFSLENSMRSSIHDYAATINPWKLLMDPPCI